jgi:hypothetical protein
MMRASGNSDRMAIITSTPHRSGRRKSITVTSGLRAQPSHSRSACASAPFHDAIELGLSRGRNAMAMWQDYSEPTNKNTSKATFG